MLLIDAHSHLGPGRVFDSWQAGQDLLAAMDRHGVTTTIAQPFPGAPDPAAVHDQIAELARSHAGRVFGMASLTPHQDPSAYQAEVERCVRSLGFVAIKAHALGFAINPRTKDARLVFDTAASLGVPVMVHTGDGAPFAEPAAWIPLALEFPETTLILGHAGAPGFTGTAIVAAQVAPNIVLETSGCKPQDIGRAIRTLGADRVMFGSDLMNNIGVELAKYQSLNVTDTDLEAVLYRNAARVFQLPTEPGKATT